MPAPVSIVIPSWNGRHLLERFLPSVVEAAAWYAHHDHGAVEILVVDDGSTDGTDVWIGGVANSAPVPIKTVRHVENLGFGAAANRGFADATHPLVWLLNNDIDVSIDGVLALARRFEGAGDELLAAHSKMVDLASHQPVGTGKMCGFARGFLRVHRSFVSRGRATSPFWSAFATGGSAMFRRDLFLALGGFDPLFAPFYLEDVELSYRAWKRGYRVCYEPRSVVRHQFSSTIGAQPAVRIERVSQRNRLLLHWIHLHDAAFLRAHVCWTALLLITRPLSWKLGFVAGFADAVRLLPEARTRRRRERQLAKRSDREVLQVFVDQAAAGGIRSYDDPRELEPDVLAEIWQE